MHVSAVGCAIIEQVKTISRNPIPVVLNSNFRFAKMQIFSAFQMINIPVAVELHCPIRFNGCKILLNPFIGCPGGKIPWIQGSLRMIPGQLALRSGQLLIAREIKEHSNPWFGFALMGVLQGVIYGHANNNWLHHLQITSVKGVPNPFRGVLFAASRDTISQGIPFMMGQYGVASVAASSILATIGSQGLHNCQTMMQMDSQVGYLSSIRNGWQQHPNRVQIYHHTLFLLSPVIPYQEPLLGH